MKSIEKSICFALSIISISHCAEHGKQRPNYQPAGRIKIPKSKPPLKRRSGSFTDGTYSPQLNAIAEIEDVFFPTENSFSSSQPPAVSELKIIKTEVRNSQNITAPLSPRERLYSDASDSGDASELGLGTDILSQGYLHKHNDRPFFHPTPPSAAALVTLANALVNTPPQSQAGTPSTARVATVYWNRTKQLEQK